MAMTGMLMNARRAKRDVKSGRYLCASEMYPNQKSCAGRTVELKLKPIVLAVTEKERCEKK